MLHVGVTANNHAHVSVACVPCILSSCWATALLRRLEKSLLSQLLLCPPFDLKRDLTVYSTIKCIDKFHPTFGNHYLVPFSKSFLLLVFWTGLLVRVVLLQMRET